MIDPVERINNATTVKELVDLLREKARFFSKDKHDWYECMFEDMAVLYNAFADRLSILSEPNGCNSPTYHGHPPVCNAAAMRHAIETAIADLQSKLELTHDQRQFIVQYLKAALSASARNCDKYESVYASDRLHADFVQYCNDCDCPMGCLHRKDTRCMLDLNCASILKCFARFVLLKAEAEKGSME